MLYNQTAKRLYHEVASGQPVYDYHCHLPLDEIAENRQFSNLAKIWLEGDHYKWRALISTAEIAIKRDAQPCLIHYNRVTSEVPGQVVEQVVDTTAAGDSFGGTYLAARLQGHDPEQAARQAHLIAGTVIQHPGAIIPVELMSFAS